MADWSKDGPQPENPSVKLTPLPLSALPGMGTFSYPARPFQRPPHMSRVCQVTGKKPRVGNTVSHANNRKRRRFLPNLHTQRFWVESEGRFVTLKVSTRGLRTIEKRGVDAVVK